MKKKIIKRGLIGAAVLLLIMALMTAYAAFSPGPNFVTWLLFGEGNLVTDESAAWVSEDESFYFYGSDVDRGIRYGRMICDEEIVEIIFYDDNRGGGFLIKEYRPDIDYRVLDKEPNLVVGDYRFKRFDEETIIVKWKNKDEFDNEKVKFLMHRRDAEEWKREMEADPRWGGPEPDIGPGLHVYDRDKDAVWVSEDDTMYFYEWTGMPRPDGEFIQNGQVEGFGFHTTNRVFEAYKNENDSSGGDALIKAIYRISGENDDVLTLTSCSGILAGAEPAVFHKKNVEEWEKGEGISLLGPPLGLRENVAWVSEDENMFFYEKSEGKPDYFGKIKYNAADTNDIYDTFEMAERNVFCPYTYRMLFSYRYDPENPKEVRVDPQNIRPTSSEPGRPNYVFRYRISPDGETLTLENRSRYEDEWKIKVLHKVNADEWRAETGTD